MWNTGAPADSFYETRPECTDVPKTRFKIKAGKTLSARKWHSAFTSDGQLDIGKTLGRIQRGGVHPSIRGEVWEFLLGCYDPRSTSDGREEIRQRRRLQYAKWKEDCRQMFPIIGSGRFITAPMVTEEGVPIQDPLVLLEANPDKGVALPPQSRSDAENSEHSTGSASTANSLDHSSTNSSEMVKEPVKSGPLDKKVIQWMLTLHQIGLDVVRTDRTLMFYENKDNLSKLWDILAVYAWIDEDVGYCQGMSDLCSPMIILLDDEVDAFWCFERLMRRLVSISLWPRFKMVFDMHLNNMRNANVKTLWEDDVHPHYVMRRYTEFTASLIHINVEFGDGQLELNLQRLRMAIDDLLIKLEKTFTKPKLQTVFLINNYDMTISVLKEAGPEGGKIQLHFEELLKCNTTIFVEELLVEHFGDLIKFVKTRASEELTSTSERPITVAEVEPLVKDFASRWKAAIELMHKDVITSFSNFLCGMEILRAALTQLLLYYTRLSDCIKRIVGGSALNKDLVSISSIMYEIRKYSRTF